LLAADSETLLKAPMPAQSDIDSSGETGVRNALLLIAGFLALRLLISWVFPATNDEAYAITVSRDWSLSYFDHPPVAFTLARLMAWLTGTESVAVIRLPFIFAGAVSGWLIWDITRLAYGRSAAFWALAWYSVAPFFFISAGHFVVPDGPLNLALLATLRLVLPDLLAPNAKLRTSRWLSAGLFFALALASKYQAALFGLSALIFLIASPAHRRLLASPTLWATLAIAMLGLVPTLVWNASHDWISITFQAGRASADSGILHPVNFLSVLGGQIIYLLPGTWLVILTASLGGLIRPERTADRLFAWFAIVPPALFLAIALLSRDSLAHWAMSGFIFGFPLAGRWTANNVDRFRGLILFTFRAACALVPAVALIVALQSRYSLAGRVIPGLAQDWEIGRELQDWTALAEAWPALGAPSAVIVKSWTFGAKAGHALGPTIDVIPLSDPRHFQYLETGAHETAIAVLPARAGDDESMLRDYVRLLENAGYRPTGDPTVISQMAGSRPQFELLVIPVEKQ